METEYWHSYGVRNSFSILIFFFSIKIFKCKKKDKTKNTKRTEIIRKTKIVSTARRRSELYVSGTH